MESATEPRKCTVCHRGNAVMDVEAPGGVLLQDVCAYCSNDIIAQKKAEDRGGKCPVCLGEKSHICPKCSK